VNPRGKIVEEAGMDRFRAALSRMVPGDWILAGGFVVLLFSSDSTWFKHLDPAVKGMIDPFTPYVHNSNNYYVHGLDGSLGQLALLLAVVALLVVANRLFAVLAVKPTVSRVLPLSAAGLSLLCIVVKALAGQTAAETRAAGLFIALIGALAMFVGAALQPGAPTAVGTVVGGLIARATPAEAPASAPAGPAPLPAAAVAIEPALFCASCGTPYAQQDARFCAKCGAKRPVR
jgi:hypothetical protein